MAMNIRKNPLAALLEYASNRGDEASSIGSVMTQLASPILKSQGVQTESAVQRGPVPQPILANVDATTINDPMFGRMVQQESGGRSGLVSPKGAAGLSQVLPSTAANPGYGVPTIFEMADRAGIPYADKSEASAKNLLLTNDALNLQFGQAYKDAMAGRYNGDPAKTAAAYNAGPGAVDAYGGVPPYPETQGYVANVVPGYNTSVSTMSAPQIGGGMPQTVEGILSTLYPDGSADEKKAHRKDILMGLSQGLSALSQGRPVDLSNIAANAEQRRRQNVIDMRERERSRAGAALIYSQTGDADMAGAVASGVMSINDVFSERERKRIAEQADTQRLKAEQANKALGGLVLGMAGDLGFSQAQVKDVATALDNGADPSSVLTLGQQAKIAEKARIDQHDKEIAAEKRNAAVEHFGQSTNPVEKTAASYMSLIPDMSWEDAIKSAQEATKTSATGATADKIQYADILVAGGKYPDRATALQALLAKGEGDTSGTANMQDAQALVASGAKNPATGKPFTLAEAMAATVLPPSSGTAMPSVTFAPDGTIRIVPPTGAPSATGTPTTAVPSVGNAFTSVSDAAKAAMLPGELQQQAADLTATQQSTAIEANKAPVDLQTAQADLAAKLQAIEEKKKAAPTAEAQAALDVEGKDLANQQAALNLKLAQSGQYVDAQTKQAALAAAELQVKSAKKAYDDAVATSEQAKVDAQKQSSDSYVNADKQFAVFEDSAKEVMAHGLENMTTGLLGQIVGKVGSYVVDQTPRSDFLAKVGTMGSQLMMGALRDAKAAGVTLTPVTDTDLQVLGKSNSLLSDPAPLSGETIVKETAFQTNYMKDALYGPKDLTRYDEFGQPYKVGLSTLGVTEDTFARHWLNVPPAVKEAWRTGKITALPTDDPNYAEAAKVINALEGNFKLYQPDVVIDRSIVGIPAPEGVSVEDWPSIWAGLSDKAKAELTKAAK